MDDRNKAWMRNHFLLCVYWICCWQNFCKVSVKIVRWTQITFILIDFLSSFVECVISLSLFPVLFIHYSMCPPPFYPLLFCFFCLMLACPHPETGIGDLLRFTHWWTGVGARGFRYPRHFQVGVIFSDLWVYTSTNSCEQMVIIDNFNARLWQCY